MARPQNTRKRHTTGPVESPRLWGKVDGLLVGLALILFLVLACRQLELPGLHYDEAKEAGNNALQLLRGLPLQGFRGASVRFLGLDFPLMVQDYIGALNVYLSIPFLAFLGIKVPALRLMPVLVASTTLVILYALAREAFDRRAAAVTVLLLAVNPTFVFWSRQGIFVTNLTGAVAVASALAALCWSRSHRPVHLYLTAFLWGLGVYAKLLFVWVIGATVVTWLVWRIAGLLVERKAKRFRSPLTDSRSFRVRISAMLPLPRELPVAVVCFMVPLMPMLLFNLRTSGGTLTALLANAGSSYYGVSNADFGANALQRLRQVLTLLRGDHLWYLGGRFANPSAPRIAAGLVASLLITAGVCRRRGSWRRASAAAFTPLAFCLLLVLQSSFTVSDLFITHFAILVPFIFLAIGAIAARLAKGGGVLVLVPVILALGWWWASDLRVTLQYHGALSATGGHAAHSDAIYDLADHLEAGGYQAPLVLDWGIEAPIYFLTSGQVRPVEVFGYEQFDVPDVAFDERLRAALQDPLSAYLFHVPEDTVFGGRRERFDELVAEAGLVPRIEAVFHERSGHMLFVLTRVE